MINGGLQARHCKKDGHVAIALHWHSKVAVQEILICYTCTHSFTLKEIIPSAHLKIRLTCAIKHCIRFNQLMHRGNPLSEELQRAARGIEAVLQRRENMEMFPFAPMWSLIFQKYNLTNDPTYPEFSMSAGQLWYSTLPKGYNQALIFDRATPVLEVSLHDICTAHVFH